MRSICCGMGSFGRKTLLAIRGNLPVPYWLQRLPTTPPYLVRVFVCVLFNFCQSWFYYAALLSAAPSNDRQKRVTWRSRVRASCNVTLCADGRLTLPPTLTSLPAGRIYTQRYSSGAIHTSSVRAGCRYAGCCAYHHADGCSH